MLLRVLLRLTSSPLFRRLDSPKRDWDVIAWWEKRRIPYNLIVGGAGLISGAVVLTMGLLVERAVGETYDPGSPLFEILAVLMYGIMANICFTGGWIFELLSRRIWRARAEAFGEIAFTWGTLSSALITLVPGALAIGIGIIRILANRWGH